MERFDYDERKAYVRRVDCDYYTDAIDYTQVKVLRGVRQRELPVRGARRVHGDVRVNRQIVGFKKIKFYTMENVGAGKLSMPEQEMHTTAFWLHFPAAFLARFADFTPTEKQAGISGPGQRAAHRRVAAADVRSARPGRGAQRADCRQPGSLRAESVSLRQLPRRHRTERAAVSAGAAIAERCRATAGGCPCEAGCPSCVGPVGEVGERGKEVAARILAELLR